MNHPKIPLIVLGGRDRRLSEQSDTGRVHHPLHGYKGAELLIGGRPLIQILIDRMLATGVFGPVFIAGPREVYEPWVEHAEVIHTDGTFGDNLRTSVEWVRQELRPEMLAVTTCDILPDEQELAVAMEDLKLHLPLDFWMPQIPIPEDPHSLGASEWKPKYRLVPYGEKKAVPILPGHIIICNPDVVRLRIVYRAFGLLYRTRNRSMAYRRVVLVRNLLWSLVVEDFKQVLKLRPPRLFVNMVYNALVFVSKLKAGVASVKDAEVRLRKVFIIHSHRKKYPDRRGRVLLTPALSLAKDIDTEEEARELENRLGE